MKNSSHFRPIILAWLEVHTDPTATHIILVVKIKIIITSPSSRIMLN